MSRGSDPDGADLHPGVTEFIRAHTRVTPVPFVPEIVLHQAGDAIALWEHTEQAAGGTNLAPPFWAFPWVGGQALARYLLDHRDIVAGRTVLDLACGSGIVAIAAALCGASRVTGADIDPTAIAAVGLNATANGVGLETVLDDVLDREHIEDIRADVVTAGDVFYSREMAARMLTFLNRAATAGAIVLVGDPGRAYIPRHPLTELVTYPVPTTTTLENSEIKATKVWRLYPGER